MPLEVDDEDVVEVIVGGRVSPVRISTATIFYVFCEKAVDVSLFSPVLKTLDVCARLMWLSCFVEVRVRVRDEGWVSVV